MERSRSFFPFVTDCLIILFGAGLILFTKDVSAAAAGAVDLCARVLLPALFPFFVLSSLCVSTGLGGRISRLAARPMERLFRLPGECAPAVILGLIGGYPVGARTAFELYDAGACDRESCGRLLGFCSCCGPAYLFSAVGAAVFGQLRAGLLLFACHALAALAIGLVSGFFARRPDRPTPRRLPCAHSANAGTFTQAVSSSFSGMLNVCAFVIFFAAAMAFLQSCGFFTLCRRLFFFLPPAAADTLARGLVEMTSGVAHLAQCGLPLPGALALAAFLCGWGGLSVHFQVLSLRDGRDIPMGRYFWGKLFHGLLAGAMTYAGALFFLRDAAACAPGYVPAGTVQSPLYFILICGVYLAVTLLTSAAAVRIDEWREKRAAAKNGCNPGAKKV